MKQRQYFAILLVLLGALLLGVAGVLAQTAQKQDDTVRIGTAEVQVEMIVTDKSGRLVRGLKTGDFQVLDDGAPRVLNYFAVVENGRIDVTQSSPSGDSTPGKADSGAANTSTGNRSPSPLVVPYGGCFVALVLDDLTLSIENFQRSKTALKEYVNTKLDPNQLVALISTSGSFGSLQQFTNDKQRLLSAIDRINPAINPSDRLRDPRYDMTAAEAVRIDAGDQTVLENVLKRLHAAGDNDPVLGGGAPARGGLGAKTQAGEAAPGQIASGSLATQVQAAAKTLAARVAALNRSKIQLLDHFFRSMADLPGRKIVVLLSESFVTAEGSSESLSTEVLQLADLARRNGVSVYALDAAGLRTSSAQASERMTASGSKVRSEIGSSFTNFENLGAARTLVSATGGSLIANTNDIVGGIDRAVQDSNAYYVIGFKPPILDNKFHRLTISVKGRPELLVRTRHGYFAIDQETARGTDTELVAILSSPIPRLDLPVQVVMNVVPKTGEQVVIAGISVGRNYLTLPQPGSPNQTAGYEIAGWVFAYGNDKPVGVVQHTLNFDLAADPEARAKLQRDGLVFVPAQPLALPPGLYQIRAVVREKNTGIVGSGYQFFEVPDVKNSKVASASGVLLTREGETGFSGQNRFKAGSRMDLHFVIYNLPKDITGLEQRVRLIDDRGNVLMDSPLPLAVAAENPQGQALQATRISVPATRGRYAVVVTLQGGKAKIEIERRADLIVE